MNVEEILARLIAFPSVVGTPNGAILDWIRHYCQAAGAEVTVIPGPEGDRSNLFATIGPRERRGYVISGHMDVVPAREPEWNSDPFLLRRDGEKLYARGTSDMKGFLACALAALPELGPMKLRQPIHLAFSYDEEAGCRGVPHLIAALPGLCEKPLGAIIGEPSRMQAVRAHKGKVAARLEVTGRSGHSSRPDLGLNAIHAMAGVIAHAVAYGQSLAEQHLDHNFELPYSSLQVGVIAGGQAVNIIPDRCTADIEVRAVPGVSPSSLLEPVKARLFALRDRGFKVAWHELSSYPALAPANGSELTALLTELTGREPLTAVSYGTEAGLYQQAGIDAVICGPGDIGRAHLPNEYIEIGELAACRRMIEDLGARLAA
ncbi:acetylornithine deacetylase [Mesorhizobium sp. BR1-1-9]|uniref:acetylornithine deacetylase n=1 Tax=unclassified Mesorhizobium TaxID=325217 RepID=UPI001CD0A3B8|nr:MULTISPECIES: acetylornithine deacetylase [unclassified Mesorhizobium]MBZ9870384.1 acetylornithine deacetylase [Mesorhizobium sp. BR1-1-9]MBZ9942344.1 acetylornithine deacetylase [Mesorhizobium sp. BR1-1-13]